MFAYFHDRRGDGTSLRAIFRFCFIYPLLFAFVSLVRATIKARKTSFFLGCSLLCSKLFTSLRLTCDAVSFTPREYGAAGLNFANTSKKQGVWMVCRVLNKIFWIDFTIFSPYFSPISTRKSYAPPPPHFFFIETIFLLSRFVDWFW